MTTLIDALPVDVLKALAKRYLKVKKDRGETPAGGLMSIQEDLARAAGHRDMHAAQSYWNRKDTPEQASDARADVLAMTQMPPEKQRVLEAAEALVRLQGWVGVEQIVEKCLRMHAKEWGVETHAEQARARVVEQVQLAIQDPRYFRVHGAKVTTASWLGLQRTLAHLAVRRDLGMAVLPVVSRHADLMSTEQVEAVSEACQTDAVVAIAAATGAGKSMVLEGVVEAYRQAGWRVMGSALSWAGTKALGTILGLGDEDCMALAPLVERSIEAAGGAFDRPTLIILDEAQQMPMSLVAELAQIAGFSAKVPVKLVVAGNPVDAMPHNALETVMQNARTCSITIDRRKPLNDGADGNDLPTKLVTAEGAAETEGTVPARVLTDKEKSARAVDPAILGRAFVQVMNDPDTHWAERPFKEFAQAMAERAAELDAAAKGSKPRPGRRIWGR